ncbi:subtilisin-like protein [Coniochaeta ligniaria NRRL 30616]|uniref:Subtilisin-like protein n=1 Tax=Coniochaeta ligniaria NRRL 30616 TaxID=1408157 RepID=A0A1J7JLZ9_9PEZI|nr:subtilisin-like protein [Coniochaeta ligniaria NRRL 30616]
MGQHLVQKPAEGEEIAPEHAHQAQILQFLIENNTSLLLDDRNSVGQTVVHIAAINGAYWALDACDWILRGDCGCNEDSAHKPSCSGLYSMIHAEDKEGHTPLYYAVLKGKTAVVGYLLLLLPNQENPASLRKLLEIAIKNQSEAGGKIVRLLLLDRQSDADECRKDIVQEETLRHAVDYFQPEVFELLLELSTEDLSEKADCNLLHYAVAKNQDEAAIMLLNSYPKLAATMQRLEGGLPTPPPGKGDGKLPLLAFYRPSEPDSELRRQILETLVEQLPISSLREHLTGPSWIGREIFLDVTRLSLEESLLQHFLLLIQKELAQKALELAKRQLERASANLEIAELKIKNRELAETELQDAQAELVASRAGLETAQLTLEFAQDELARIKSQSAGQNAEARGYPGAMRDRLNQRSGVDFEHVLKYVNIPSFDIGVAERRTEALFIFNWLRDCRDVERVFQVRVDDCRHCPTSEEDIEAALSGLDVKHLDWRRTDLSVSSIVAAAKNVETLHLYSSGNLAALDHWFGPEGVSLLKKLTTLHIKIIQDDFISAARADKCLTKCNDAAASLPEGITLKASIMLTWSRSSGGDPTRGPTGLIRKHRPIEVMDLEEFVSVYRSAQLSIEPIPDPGANAATSRTKVAILDSGISHARFSTRSHRVLGRSFVWTNPDDVTELEAPWWLAPDPHGSQMANIISQLDPHCEFYIAQIAEDMRYIRESNVIKALEWVLSEGVQIINCSFALRDWNQAHSPSLRDVILRAKDMGVVIMCSTSDEGDLTEKVWPAAFHNTDKSAAEPFDNVFPIVGCDEHGKPSRFANERAGRFFFRGEDIDASGTEPDLLKERGMVLGSSVATAIATGVGSLVLACYQMIRVREGLHTTVKPPSVVNSVFHQMLSKSEGMQDKPPLYDLVTAGKFFPTTEDELLDEDEFFTTLVNNYANALKEDLVRYERD